MERRLWPKLAGVALMYASVATPGESAEILFSQPWVGSSGVIDSDYYSCCQAADDFALLADSWVTDFHWWGAYTDTPSEATAPEAYFDLYVFPDLGSLQAMSGYEGSPLTSVSRTDTGALTINGDAIFAYTADLASPFLLTAGTYYALLVGEGNPFTHQDAQWSMVGPTAGAGFWYLNINGGGVWFQTFADLAFEVTGSPVVPEPATLLLLGTGLAAAGVRRRMKKRG